MKDNDSGLKNGATLIQLICGGRLTSVDFVLNYLVLGFDHRGALTALVWPEICGGENTVKFGMSGYRDRLCEMVAMVITDVSITFDETIIIGFGNDLRLRIPLRECKTPGERAIVTAPKHHLYVW